MWRIIFRFYLQSEIKRQRKAVGIKMPDDVRRAQTDLVIKLIAAASNINIHYYVILTWSCPLGVAQQAFEGEGADVVQRLLALRVRRTRQDSIYRLLRQVLGLKLLMLGEHNILGLAQARNSDGGARPRAASQGGIAGACMGRAID
jgi:hypothetical protein